MAKTPGTLVSSAASGRRTPLMVSRRSTGTSVPVRMNPHLSRRSVPSSQSVRGAEPMNTKSPSAGTRRVAPDWRSRSCNAVRRSSPSGEVRIGETRAYFSETGEVIVGLHARDRLAADERVAGPAIVVDEWTTTVVYPGQSAVMDAYGNLVLEVEA